MFVVSLRLLLLALGVSCFFVVYCVLMYGVVCGCLFVVVSWVLDVVCCVLLVVAWCFLLLFDRFVC